MEAVPRASIAASPSSSTSEASALPLTPCLRLRDGEPAAEAVEEAAAEAELGPACCLESPRSPDAAAVTASAFWRWEPALSPTLRSERRYEHSQARGCLKNDAHCRGGGQHTEAALRARSFLCTRYACFSIVLCASNRARLSATKAKHSGKSPRVKVSLDVELHFAEHGLARVGHRHCDARHAQQRVNACAQGRVTGPRRSRRNRSRATGKLVAHDEGEEERRTIVQRGGAVARSDQLFNLATEPRFLESAHGH